MSPVSLGKGSGAGVGGSRSAIQQRSVMSAFGKAPATAPVSDRVSLVPGTISTLLKRGEERKRKHTLDSWPSWVPVLAGEALKALQIPLRKHDPEALLITL